MKKKYINDKLMLQLNKDKMELFAVVMEKIQDYMENVSATVENLADMSREIRQQLKKIDEKFYVKFDVKNILDGRVTVFFYYEDEKVHWIEGL